MHTDGGAQKKAQERTDQILLFFSATEREKKTRIRQTGTSCATYIHIALPPPPNLQTSKPNPDESLYLLEPAVFGLGPKRRLLVDIQEDTLVARAHQAIGL